jgi:hypothetical protein
MQPIEFLELIHSSAGRMDRMDVLPLNVDRLNAMGRWPVVEEIFVFEDVNSAMA